MKFGYFDDKAKEYVITTPHTPLPWINYLGSNDFFSLISNTCGGYSFIKMQNCCELPGTVIIIFLQIPTESIIILMMTE